MSPTSSFQADLGLDSLDTVEVVMAFEEEFSVEIPDAEADKILSVADAVAYLSAHPQARAHWAGETGATPPHSRSWPPLARAHPQAK